MSGYLVFLFLLTLAYIAYFSLAGSRRPEGARGGKVLTAGYLFLTAITLIAAMVMHFQFPGAKVAASVRHIQFRGVDVTLANLDSDVSNVRLSGDAIDGESDVKRGFRWFGLASGGWIDLLPDQTENNKIVSYRAVAHRVPQVVRLNRHSINLPLGGWADVGSKPQYRVDRTRRSSRRGGDSFQFALEIGDGEVRVLSELDGNATHATGLKNRISLRDLLGASGAAKLATALAGHTTPDGFPLLDRLTVVRYVAGDGQSAVGIVGADMPPVAEADSVEYKLALSRVDKQPEKASPSIAAVDGKFRLDAIRGTSRSTLTLPSEAQPTKEGHVRLRFEFNPPRSYPLPPAELLKKSGNTVRLASVDIGQPGDGYLFDTGNLNESYTATAKLSPSGDRMAFVGSANDKEESIEPNKPYPLSSGAVTPVFSLADPLRDAGTPWLLPAGGLVAGMLLCVAAFTRLPSRKRARAMLPRGLAGSHFAFILWACAATLLTVRLILAYRVSLLPPFNMDTAAALSYQDTWPKAVAAMLLILPGLGLLTFLVVRFKERATVPPLVLRFGETLQRSLPKLSARPYHSLAMTSFITAFVLALLSAIHKKFPILPFPDAALLGVLLLVLGVVFEGVGDVRDEALAEDQPEPPTAKERLQAIGEKLPEQVTAKVAKAKDYIDKRPFLQKSAAWIGRFSRNRLLWLTAILLLYVDPGTFLFILPFCLALCVGAISSAFGRREPAIIAKAAFLGLLAVFLIGVRVAPNIGGKMLTGSIIGKLAGGSSISYRMAATEPQFAESLLLDPDTRHGAFNPRDMQRTLHQRWQMIAYTKGSGAGYFQAPLSNLGMTYPTMLSDASFSVFLLGEHGKLTGWMVIGFLLLISFTVFRAAWAAATSRTQRSNVLGLYAIAGIIGASGVYMALANLWLVPFTGQNVPFLSLNSVKDLILNGCLLAAAILLIAFPGTFSNQSDPNAKKEAKRTAWLWWSFPALLGLGWIVLGIALLRTSGDPAEPFNYSKETLDNLQQIVDAANDRARREQVPLNQVASVQTASPLVKSLVTSYVAGEVTETPIDESRSGSRLVIDRRFFRLPSPFEVNTGVAWHGSLLAQGAVRRHQLFIGGSRVPVILRADAGPADLILGRRVKPITAQAIALKQEIRERGRATEYVDYGGFKLVKDKVVFRWRSSGKPGTILVNGSRPDLPLNEVTLTQDDVITLEYSAPDGVSEKLTIVYPGPTEAKLSLVSWRNGRYRRTFPQGSDFPLAYTIAQVGDENVKYGDKKLENVALSLDLGLQRELQNKLRQWCISQGRLTDTGSRLPDGLPFTTITILDSYTGQVRALAALPQRDPNDGFDSIRDLFPTERDALLSSRSSWAFANRTIGSSVKPLTFSAISSQLNGNLDLTKLHVNEVIAVESTDDGRAYRQLGDIHLPRGRNLSRRENPRSDVDMAEFLRDSRTWPAIVVGTLGLVSDKSDSKRQKSELTSIFEGPQGYIRLDGRSVGFQPHAGLDRIFTKGLDLNSVELADTALFRGLQECYGPSVVPFNVNEAEPWDDALAKSFLAPLDLSAVQSSELKRLGMPDLHRADTTNMTKFDLQLVQYMIGGGESRWNALTMATNGARLMTGKKVMPTFDAKATAAKQPMPAPLDGLAWRQAHLITPLRNITTMGSDGDALRSTASAAGYVIAMKTGTIDDGMGDRARESEMLMFTIGRYSEATGFAPGQSISGFLSIRSSKMASGEPIIKGDLMKALMPTLIRYLQSHGGGKR